MSTIYLTQDGAIVRKTGERLRVTLEKETLLDLPLIKVDQLVVFGNITVTQAALQKLLEQGADLVFLTSHGRYLGRLQPEFSKNGILRRAQYAASQDSKRSLVGRALSEESFSTCGHRSVPRKVVKIAWPSQIRAMVDQLARTESWRLSIEGAGTAVYFQTFDVSGRGSIPGRVRRPLQTRSTLCFPSATCFV